MTAMIGAKEWGGVAGPGHGVGLLAADLVTPGASITDLPVSERKKLLEEGSSYQLAGSLAGGALGAGLAGVAGDSAGEHIWNAIGGGSLGSLIGGFSVPAIHGAIKGHRELKDVAEEKAEPVRKHREAMEAGAKRASSAFSETHHIGLDVNKAVLPELTKLLEALRVLTSMGASRSVKIEDGDSFFIDGDGSDCIRKIEVDGEEYEKEACWATEYAKTAGLHGALYGGAMGGAVGGVAGSALNRDSQRGFVTGTTVGVPLGALIGYELEDSRSRRALSPEDEAALGQPSKTALVPETLAVAGSLTSPFIERTDKNMNTPEALHPDYHMKGRAIGIGAGHLLGKGLGALGGGLISGALGDATFGPDSIMNTEFPLFANESLPGISASEAVGGILGNHLGGYAGAVGGGIAGSAIGSHIKGPGHAAMPKPPEQNTKRAFTDDFSFLKKMAALASSCIDTKGMRTRTGYYRWLANKRLQPANG